MFALHIPSILEALEEQRTWNDINELRCIHAKGYNDNLTKSNDFVEIPPTPMVVEGFMS